MSAVAEPAVFPIPGHPTDRRTGVEQDVQKFAEAALAESKREGLLLAVRARWVALAVTAVTLPIVNPNWEVIYYVADARPFRRHRLGPAQGRQGRRVPAGAVPDVLRPGVDDLPRCRAQSLAARHWPMAMQFRFDAFIYFFVFLATATLAYSWRTVVAMGIWTAALWALGVTWV